MDTMSETMVLKRKHSPTPQDWENATDQQDDPTLSLSTTDEISCESPKPKKKRKKQVKFNGVTVYYFQRSQGFTCVPSQGGSTLGMEHTHELKENYSLNAFALEQDRQHRELLKEQLLERKQRQMLEQNDPELLEKSIQEIAESELAKINVEEYYFLQPVTTKRRRLMLRSAGVNKIESWEKSELKMIRLSREKCGCDCKVVCNPSTCACSIAGIKCQVDRLSFPCGCSKDGCGNNTGRVEFNPIKVRTHFLHTLMRLEVEKGQNNESCAANRTDTDNETNYTKLEISTCLDETSDRVLDHGQCKECDSIPYTDYNDQYPAGQYLNGQKTGLQGQFVQQMDSTMYNTPMNFSCNSDIPLDLQSNSNQQVACVNYDEAKHDTFNSSNENSCNFPSSVINEYDSSSSEESATSESDSEPPYIPPTTTSLGSTEFDLASTNTEKSIFQTPESSPDHQYTRLMPLDLSHALGDYDETPTYTQLSTSSRACSASYNAQISETPLISSHASMYTDYANCHFSFFNDPCKQEEACMQKLNTRSDDNLNLTNSTSQCIMALDNRSSELSGQSETMVNYLQESPPRDDVERNNILNVICGEGTAHQFVREDNCGTSFTGMCSYPKFPSGDQGDSLSNKISNEPKLTEIENSQVLHETDKISRFIVEKINKTFDEKLEPNQTFNLLEEQGCLVNNERFSGDVEEATLDLANLPVLEFTTPDNHQAENLENDSGKNIEYQSNEQLVSSDEGSVAINHPILESTTTDKGQADHFENDSGENECQSFKQLISSDEGSVDVNHTVLESTTTDKGQADRFENDSGENECQSNKQLISSDEGIVEVNHTVLEITTADNDQADHSENIECQSNKHMSSDDESVDAGYQSNKHINSSEDKRVDVGCQSNKHLMSSDNGSLEHLLSDTRSIERNSDDSCAEKVVEKTLSESFVVKNLDEISESEICAKIAGIPLQLCESKEDILLESNVVFKEPSNIATNMDLPPVDVSCKGILAAQGGATLSTYLESDCLTPQIKDRPCNVMISSSNIHQNPSVDGMIQTEEKINDLSSAEHISDIDNNSRSLSSDLSSIILNNI